MVEVKHGRGYVYSIQYHVVWCVKYRHKVLIDNIDKRLKEILHQIDSIPSTIKALKGVSARLLFKEFPQLKKKLWGGHLWNPSYFVATVSEHTEEQSRRYIQNQQKKY
jgi:putative transposase